MTRRLAEKRRRILCRALAACVVALLAIVPAVARAEELVLSEGDVTRALVPEGTPSESSDPSVAWIDASGNLNALRAGTATITAADQTYDVTVNDYVDGSDVVGNLKLVARYNDDMQFYDGHVYLMFTSYQDDVNIAVDDLYASYRISNQYYTDIKNDIANGSNHTGTNADKYFALTNDTSVTLNRGELVTVGMYRDFDMSVADAALGCIQNSTLWAGLSDAAKTDIMQKLFQGINGDPATDESKLAEEIEQILEAEGVDYNALLDGVVSGGVCFNRELYNQKLEWDQYENVTYDLDITRNQLNALVASLGGNLNKFSILKNSCATVALRAWNAAVGTRDGADTAYKLDSAGTGIFSIIDAPKTARDAVVNRLPGYYLNNANNVAEPGAGFVDDTGCVYVSAPKQVAPLAFVQDGPLVVDDSRSSMEALLRVAKAGTAVSYGKEQQVDVAVDATTQDNVTTVNRVDFTVNDTVVSLDSSSPLEEGVWFKAALPDPLPGATIHVTDAEGNALPSEIADGFVYVHADSLPFVFKLTGDDENATNVLATKIVKPDAAIVQTDVYYYDGDQKVMLGSKEALPSGTQLYIKNTYDALEYQHLLTGITLNGVQVMDADHFDAQEEAYTVAMSDCYSQLVVTYQAGEVEATRGYRVQVPTGTVMDVQDYFDLVIGEDRQTSKDLYWSVLASIEGAVEYTDDTHTKIVATTPGLAGVMGSSAENRMMGKMLSLDIYPADKEMVAINYAGDNLEVSWKKDTNQYRPVLQSGFLVEKGVPAIAFTTQTNGTVVSRLTNNGRTLKPGEIFEAIEDANIEVGFREATIKGMPGSVRLASKDDAYQLNASVRYKGLASILPVYDPSITYESSDPLVAVDKTGKITLTGDVPAEGTAVIVTAYAGSSNKSVSAQTKVIVGDYKGADIVGRLTVSARRIDKSEPTPHGAITFTAYSCMDMDVSYYYYYRPTDQYMALMADYRDHPENYTSDPALYSNNELGLTDRDSYFEVLKQGSESDPQPVSLACGESITVSNYMHDASNYDAVLQAIANGTMASDPYAQALAQQMRAYLENGEVDNGTVAFDSFIQTLVRAFAITNATGHNPLDGLVSGGLDIDRELYNRFTRGDEQTPNTFYTVEITADELASFKQYVSNPKNNVWGLFEKNCATSTVGLWNATLSDRPELQLTANYTGLAVDPQSLYVEIGKLQLATGKSYEPGVEGKEEGGGLDFTPYTFINCTCDEGVAPAANTLTYTGAAQELVTPGESPCGTMSYSLDGQSFDEQIPVGTDAGTYTVYYKPLGRCHTGAEAKSVQVTIAKAAINPSVAMASYMVGGKAPTPIVSGNTGNGAVTYSYAKKGSKEFSEAVPTTVGDYTVKATIEETANYLGGEATCDFSIDKAPTPPPAPTLPMPKAKKGLVADGTKQELLTPPSKLPAGYTKIQYSLDGGKTWSNKIPCGTKAGTYIVHVRYVGPQRDTFQTDPLMVTIAPMPTASVVAHVQRSGWLGAAKAGKPAGTIGKSLRLEALRISLNDANVSGGIEYRTHVQRLGWEKSWARDGAVAGTTGKSLRLEAVQIRLYGQMAKKYDVYYRVHSQQYGWMGWAKNGQKAGTAGFSYRAEAVQVVLVKKGAAAPTTTYQGVVQTDARPFATKK